MKAIIMLLDAGGVGKTADQREHSSTSHVPERGIACPRGWRVCWRVALDGES
jgi:hypothetical protein